MKRLLMIGILGLAASNVALAFRTGARTQRGVFYGGSCLAGKDFRHCSRTSHTVRLGYQPKEIESIEFYAHDGVGNNSDGKLTVMVDNMVVASNINIKKAGRLHRIYLGGRHRRPICGSRITFRAAKDDVKIGQIVVTYRNTRDGRRGGNRRW